MPTNLKTLCIRGLKCREPRSPNRTRYKDMSLKLLCCLVKERRANPPSKVLPTEPSTLYQSAWLHLTAVYEGVIQFAYLIQFSFHLVPISPSFNFPIRFHLFLTRTALLSLSHRNHDTATSRHSGGTHFRRHYTAQSPRTANPGSILCYKCHGAM